MPLRRLAFGLVLLPSGLTFAAPPENPPATAAVQKAQAGPTPAAAQPVPPPKPNPIVERADALRQAASLLDKADAASKRGNRNYAEQLFSAAELIVGPQALAELAPAFREGAPPFVHTPLQMLSKDAPPQPVMMGSSDEDAPPPKPLRGSLSGTLQIEGKEAHALGVVTLEPVNGKLHRPHAQRRVMEQRGRQFAPRLLVVPVGSTVVFPNYDPIYHNVFSRSEVMPFDLGIYRNGQARELTFDKEGIVQVGCNLHENMTAHIVAVSVPHYAVTDANGAFHFKSLEPGKYKLRAWSERSATPITVDIVIKPGANNATVAVAADAPVTVATDKFGAPRAKKP
jgi:plastocyanin